MQLCSRPIGYSILLFNMDALYEDWSDSEVEAFFAENEHLLEAEARQSERVEHCYCGIPSTSEKVIKCSNHDCHKHWLHLECVGLSEVPDNEWFCCPQCLKQSVFSSQEIEHQELPGSSHADSPSTSQRPPQTDVAKKIGPGKRVKGKMKYPAKKKVDETVVTNCASEYLDCALKGLSTSYIVKMNTPLSLSVQELCKKLLMNIDANALTMYSKVIVGQLWDIASSLRGKSWSEEMKQKMWRDFHILRSSNSTKNSWHVLLQEMQLSQLPDIELFLFQTILQDIFKSLIKFVMDTDLPPEATTNITQGMLDVNEENALRYACGYIPYKLKKRFGAMKENAVATEVLSMLDGWGSTEGAGDSFLAYTEQWIKLQNRGGLFTVKDDVFKFFRAIELIARSVLHLKNMNFIQACDIQQVLFSQIVVAKTVTFCWSKITAEGLPSTVKHKLLEEVVKCYIKMRCEAFIRVYLMLRKEKDACISRKSEKGLRKELQK